MLLLLFAVVIIVVSIVIVVTVVVSIVVLVVVNIPDHLHLKIRNQILGAHDPDDYCRVFFWCDVTGMSSAQAWASLAQTKR